MKKLLLVAMAVLVGALLFLPLGLIPSFGPAIEQPPTVDLPDAVPEGTVYWVDAEYEFQHAFVDSEGKGTWDLVNVHATGGLPSSYRQHTLTVWEQNLDEGYSWNLQGKCTLTGEVRVFWVRADGLYYKGLIVWPGLNQATLSFPCNQGARGSLFLRPPTFFIKDVLPGEPGFVYHLNFVGTVDFISGDYKETSSFDGGPIFCPSDRPADYC